VSVKNGKAMLDSNMAVRVFPTNDLPLSLFRGPRTIQKTPPSAPTVLRVFEQSALYVTTSSFFAI